MKEVKVTKINDIMADIAAANARYDALSPEKKAEYDALLEKHSAAARKGITAMLTPEIREVSRRMKEILEGA
jgi:hypothetical protein